MSLPNLGALRLTAPTSELFPITADDEEKNGGEPFEDPTDYEELPLGSQTRTFRVEKVPGNPERGYNWHNARNLAKWVKQQIEQGKFPVVDPYRTPMSKSDVDQLRFEIDQDIPPYDPSVPPPDDASDDEGEIEVEPPLPIVSMKFEADFDFDSDHDENIYVIECGISQSANPDLFERLKPYFMERREDGTFSYRASSLSFEPLSHSRYDTTHPIIRYKRSIFVDTMRLMDLPDLFLESLDMRQRNFHCALHDLGGTLMRQLLENRGYMTSTASLDTLFTMYTDRLILGWEFTDLRNAFFETMQSELVDDEDLEFPNQYLFRSILQTLRDLFQEIIQHVGFHMSPMPRSPIFQEQYPGHIDRSLTFDVVPRPLPKEKMSLPNLAGLRLTAPTGELFPITAEDEEKNGGQPFEDPTDYEELPLGSQTRTFRVEKVPGNPERGYNWHNAKTLAKWVKQQIEQGKFPVVDPYRTPMSKSDVDQLRFEIDQDIPPYDPSVPPPDDASGDDTSGWSEPESNVSEPDAESSDEEELYDHEFSRTVENMPHYIVSEYGWPVPQGYRATVNTRLMGFTAPLDEGPSPRLIAMIQPMAMLPSSLVRTPFHDRFPSLLATFVQAHASVKQAFAATMRTGVMSAYFTDAMKHQPMLCGEGQSPDPVAYAIFYHPDLSFLRTLIADAQLPEASRVWQTDFRRPLVQQRPILGLLRGEYERSLLEVSTRFQFPKRFKPILLACDRVRLEVAYQEQGPYAVPAPWWPFRRPEHLRHAEETLLLLLQNQSSTSMRHVNESTLDGKLLMTSSMERSAVQPFKRVQPPDAGADTLVTPFVMLYGDANERLNRDWYGEFGTTQLGYLKSTATRAEPQPGQRAVFKYSERSMWILFYDGGYLCSRIDLFALCRNFDSYLLMTISITSQNGNFPVNEYFQYWTVADNSREAFRTMLDEFKVIKRGAGEIPPHRLSQIPVDIAEFLVVLRSLGLVDSRGMSELATENSSAPVVAEFADAVLSGLNTMQEHGFSFNTVPRSSTKMHQYTRLWQKRVPALLREDEITLDHWFEDNIDYIRRTMQFLKAAASAAVLEMGLQAEVPMAFE